MRVTVPTEVAIVLARFRTFAVLLDDDTSEVVLALLVLAPFLVEEE